MPRKMQHTIHYFTINGTPQSETKDSVRDAHARVKEIMREFRDDGYRVTGGPHKGIATVKKRNGAIITDIKLHSHEPGDAPVQETQGSDAQAQESNSDEPQRAVLPPTPAVDSITGVGVFDRLKVDKQFRARDWEAVETVAPHADRILLWGPPGTGKSHFARAVANDMGVKCYTVVCTEETPSAEVRGHWINKGGNDGFVWLNGTGTMGWREGAVFHADEIDKSSGDLLQFMLGLLDDQQIASLTLPTGETIRPRPGFKCIATMNGDIADLPEALQSRFAINMEITHPHPQAVMRLSADIRNAAWGSCSTDDDDRRLTLRHWKEFDKLRQFVSPKIAADVIFKDRSREILEGLKTAAAAETV